MSDLLTALCINNWFETLKKLFWHWNGRWWGSLQKNANVTLLHLIGKRSRAAGLLAKLIWGWPQTHLLAIPSAWPIAVLVIPFLVIAARVFLHWVWKVSLSWGMPASFLENKPDISSPEDEVQESKDLKENESKWVDTQDRNPRKISISEKSFTTQRSFSLQCVASSNFSFGTTISLRISDFYWMLTTF